ncbi:MAG: CotH kinase family protein [Oscillospiraceae bacterium]|nr:CotH kinase family protein [Candidatus Ruminococcus equi]
MKNFNLCKRTVSILLCLLMVLSMTTIGIVSTSAANVDTATTGGTYVKFTRPSFWNQGDIYVYNNDGTAWPGHKMNDVGDDGYGNRVFGCDVGSPSLLVFNDNAGHQTVDINSGITNNAQWYCNGENEKDGSGHYLVTLVGGDTPTPSSEWCVPGFENWAIGAHPTTNGSVTIHLTAGDNQAFKISNGTTTWYGCGGKITRDSCTNYEFHDYDGDAHINADVTGDYVFTITKNGNNNPVLTVTYPGSEPPTETPTEAPTPTDTMRVYFTYPEGWNNLKVHYWGPTTSTTYPGVGVTWYKKNDFNQDVFYADIPADSDGVLFNSDGMDTVNITKNGEYPLVGGRGYYLYDNREQDSQGKYKVAWYNESENVITYKLAYGSDEVAEYDLTPGTPIVASLTAGTKYTFAVEKFVNGNQTATYKAAKEIEGASFDEALSEKATSALTFTPNESGDYKIIFNKDSLKLSCSMSGTRRIYFQDATDTKWISDYDANITVTAGADTVTMKESIDTLTGLKTWYADVKDSATSYTFKRVAFVGGTVWNTWSAGYNASNPLFKVTSDTAGTWQASVNVADGSVSNFWAGLYCDTKGNADPADFVRMYEKDASNYFLYLPSYVDLSNAKIYSTYYSASIRGGAYSTAKKIYSNTDTSVPYGIENTLNLVNDGTFELKFKYTSGAAEQTKTLHVMQTQKTAALLLTTNEELYTGLIAGSFGDTAAYSPSEYKEAITTKGTYSMYSEKGAQIVGDNNKVKKIKGRGNSSFEASMRLYGKYAYNLSLDKKAKFVDGANKSKKWCLLANNADESMLRTTLVFKIAEEVGVAYAPKTRLIDFYDNGKYLGAYVIAEKVEYGGNTMMETAPNGEEVVSLDDINEDFAGDLYGDIEDADRSEGEFTTSLGHKYTFQYTDYATIVGEDVPASLYETGDFVMEFELYNRYQAEASWFVEPTTHQAVCMKYPEFASESEMQWIIEQFDQMWDAVYNNKVSQFEAVADTASFSKTYLIQELTMNLDSAATSYYVTGGAHFDKLIAAPVWDYDWSCGDYYYSKQLANGSTLSMDNCNEFFVSNKSINTDQGKDPKQVSTKCFEAKLCDMDGFWTENEKQWQNLFFPTLSKYIDSNRADGDSGVLLKELYPAFKSAAEMNESRWNAMGNLYDRHGDAYWGTKCTSTYKTDLMVGTSIAYGNTINYYNTVSYLNDWLAARKNKMDQELRHGEYQYIFGESSFTCSDPTSEKITTVTPALSITQGNEVVQDIKYTIYVNGKAKGTFDYEEGVGQQVTLAAGTNEVYVEFYPADMPDMKKELDAQEIIIAEEGGEVELTIYFKSSDSLRYLPTVVVNGKEKVMKQDEVIKTNENQTQTFSWYKANVNAVLGDSLTLKFTNAIGMRATVTVENVSYQPYYFAADNLNTATEAYDYTTNGATETQRNFVRNATNLVYNSSNGISNTSLAYTSIGGTQYVLGDVDGDGELTILDVTAVQKDLAQVEALEGVSKSLGDFLLDGDLSIADGTAIQKFLCKLPF